jgi:hypothetical protein
VRSSTRGPLQRGSYWYRMLTALWMLCDGKVMRRVCVVVS